jgi:steroid delta-isomerase-like uncharacterized protein
MTTTDDNRELVRSYLHAFNERDWSALSDYLAEDVVEHGVHDELHGPEEVTDFLRSYFDTFPDYSGSTEAMIAEGDTVGVRYTASGTHSDDYQDVEPTGRELEWTGMAMYRVEDDRIAEVWVEEDRLGLLERLEAVDPPAHLRL